MRCCRTLATPNRRRARAGLGRAGQPMRFPRARFPRHSQETHGGCCSSVISSAIRRAAIADERFTPCAHPRCSLFDQRRVGHVKLHGYFCSVFIIESDRNRARTKDFLQRIFGNGNRSLVRSRRPIVLLFVVCIVGAISDGNLWIIGQCHESLPARRSRSSVWFRPEDWRPGIYAWKGEVRYRGCSPGPKQDDWSLDRSAHLGICRPR
jgi:hypothetical protein